MFFPPLIFLMMLVFFVVAVILLPFLLLGLIGEAFLRLGLPPGLVFSLLILTLLGSLVNIPIYRFAVPGGVRGPNHLLFRHALSGCPRRRPTRPCWPSTSAGP